MAIVDLHAHVLAGVDDGPADLSEALALLAALADEDVETVFATPHILPHRYDVDVAERDERLAELRAAATASGLGIAIEPGGELDLEFAASWSDEQLRGFALGGRAILIEFPWGGAWPLSLGAVCTALRRRDFLPVVAHPERVRVVQAAPERIDQVMVGGGVCQLTAGSLAGAHGAAAQQTACFLLETGRAHCLASDAHHAVTRGPCYDAAREMLVATYGADYAAQLLDASRDVLAGRVPALARPERVRRGRRWRR